MRAIVFDNPGEPEVLKLGEFEKPVPKENEILIKVAATALNRADTLQRKGMYPPPQGASPLLGLEIAGTVTQVGDNVDKWQKGEKVFGLVPGGGYAEYAVIHQDMAMRIPQNFSFEQAAAIPEVFLTAYQALVWNGRLQKGETVLIHAGASGVGTAAIQMAKEMGARVFVTASKSKHQICLDLGAEKAIDYRSEDFSDKILEYTNGKGVNLIIDFVAGPYLNQNIKSLAVDGRLVNLATLGGGKVDDFDMRSILSKRLTVIGSTLRSRSLDYQIKLTREFAAFAIERFNSGKIQPVIDSVFDWIKAAKAHRYMEENKNSGKIVLKID
ncbi:MAG: NAD(P)H-quinone oxidoreductase [Bacteroidales bacterium]|nr:NAD(P)H-quinone oxidoreductase [Bacteroidales bacterium]